jgi:hypothetical protein
LEVVLLLSQRKINDEFLSPSFQPQVEERVAGAASPGES